MSSPRDPGRDLDLERLDDRDGLQRAYLGEVSQVRTLEGPTSKVGQFSAAYQALIDAVFTAPGATEWLNRLRQRVAAFLAGKGATGPHDAGKGATQPHDVACDAICQGPLVRGGF